MPSSSEASTSIKAPSSFYSSFSAISEASKGFWRQHTYDKNTSWAARVQETEIYWTGTKTS